MPVFPPADTLFGGRCQAKFASTHPRTKPQRQYNPVVAINIETQVAYWSDGAREDFAVAGELLASRRTRHGMFFLHLNFKPKR